MAGVTKERCLSSITVKRTADVPAKLTPVVPVNPDPVTVTTVPPATGPPEGEMEEITGNAADSVTIDVADTGAKTANSRTRAVQDMMQNGSGCPVQSVLPDLCAV